MTIKTYPQVINFKNNTTETDENADFALRMKNAIDVQLIDTNLYMSKELWLPYGARGAYGGQIVAQALRAAWDTVPEDFFIHSLHSYFILACDVDIPVIYSVQRIRDGKSFATRIVKATQKGRAIFVCSFSFTKPSNAISLNHQADMPNVVDPETLLSDMEALKNALNIADNLPDSVKEKAQNRLQDDQPIDYRIINNYTPEEIITGSIAPDPSQRQWFKTRGALNDDMKLHACIIAYASDSGFLNTAAAANGYTFGSEGIGMLTSLDHTVWFHTPARADEWLLYDIFSPRANGGRGVAFGRIYSRDGILVATTAQEGVVRLTPLEQQRLKKAQEDLEKELLHNLHKSRL